MITYPILRLYLEGETIEFKNEDIIEATVVQEISSLGMELPASTAEVSVYTTNSDFNPFNSARYFQALKANTLADLIEYTDGVEKFISRFYLDEWDNPSKDVLKFNLQDVIGVMENIMFDGLFYENPTDISVIISNLKIHAPCDIIIDSDLTDVKLMGYIPGHITLREALQQVCFAAGAYATTQGIDHILIKPSKLPHSRAVFPSYYGNSLATYDTLNVRYSDYVIEDTITNLDKLEKQELILQPMVTGVELVTHDYTKSDTVETIFSDTLEPGDYKIIYEKPYGDVLVDGAGDIPEWLATENDEIFVTEDSGIYPEVTIIGKTGAWEYGPNSISLHIIIESLITITGHPYNDNTQVLVWSNPDAIQSYTEGGVYDDPVSKYDNLDTVYWRLYSIKAATNAWRITDATLVSKSIGQTVLDRIVQYAQARHEQTITALAGKEIETGTIYLLDSLYNKKLVASAELITTNLSGGNLKETRLIGTEKLEG